MGLTHLPLAISFFTFQQIAFLTSFYRSSLSRPGMLSYGSSILFFPHLLAGPIIRPADLMPQLENKGIFTFNPQNISIGLTIFILGLVKKVLLADAAAPHVDTIFNAVDAGAVPSVIDAWLGVSLFSFQTSKYLKIPIRKKTSYGIRVITLTQNIFVAL